MTVAPGTRLGPYEVLAPIGAGGMGEVYRARDEKLRRDVALKVLPDSFSRDPEALTRFTREAHALSALSHPGILAIYDFGSEGEVTYAVTELLEGDTLREHLRDGPLPMRKAVEYAIQIAQGLGAAHAKGIVHRDLKPANVFITTDGRVKLLDFGIAKTLPTAPPEDETSAPTIRQVTEKQTMLGSRGYMSPEQVRGHSVDHRSDIFSFGALLYEMLTGEQAFRRETWGDTIVAILKEDPERLEKIVPPTLQRIVRHCLEKSPDERFGSAADVAFDLQSLDLSTETRPLAVGGISMRRPRWQSVAIALLLAALPISVVVTRRLAGPSSARFQRLTFQRGSIWGARFAPGGRTVVYGAAWQGDPMRVFTARTEAPGFTALALPDANLLAVSNAGELAIQRQPRMTSTFQFAGTLARVPLSGGTPHDVRDEVEFADWSPDGKELAIVSIVAGKRRLEYPIGRVLFETGGWIGNPRVSPDGRTVAFIDHSAAADLGSVSLVDRVGKRRILSDGWISAQGVAWSPSGREVLFAATRKGNDRAVYAVSLSGRERLVLAGPSRFTLFDMDGEGRLLLMQDHVTLAIGGVARGETRTRDLSLYDYSALRDISADGTTIAFDETGDAGGDTGSAYLRRMDGSPPVRVADGAAGGISPDGKWVATFAVDLSRITLVPTSAGAPRVLTFPGLICAFPSFFPDGRRLLFRANTQGRGTSLYAVDLPDGKPKAISPDDIDVSSDAPVSPDGRFAVGKSVDGKVRIYPVDGGEPRLLDSLEANDWPTRWSGDGRFLYVYRRQEIPCRVFRLEVATGRKEPWMDVTPDPAGFLTVGPVLPSPDGSSYAYSLQRVLSELFLVEGTR